MAFLDETGLTELWKLIKARDDVVTTLANTKCQIETGSYVGTGKYGSSNPTSLTFNFVPKLVIIYGVGDANSVVRDAWAIIPAFWLTSEFSEKGYLYDGGDISQYCYAKIVDKTVSWYYQNSTESTAVRNGLNAAITYKYVAFG